MFKLKQSMNKTNSYGLIRLIKIKNIQNKNRIFIFLSKTSNNVESKETFCQSFFPPLSLTLFRKEETIYMRVHHLFFKRLLHGLVR